MSEPQHVGDNLIGGMLLGRYRVVRELAKGGMGVVYLARVEGAVGFVKPVVIKLILPEHAADERFLRMFAREAQIVSQLRHPGVVDVLEFGEQDGAYVMVLEYVRGHHLGQWCRYLALSGRSVPPEIAIQVASDVLDALHHAHGLTHPDGTPMHIVHRDISPSNILLDEDGRARLLDFGVARMRGGSIDYQTQANGFVGKLTYTAPEIFAGSEASQQSDLYSCAVVLHEAILGHNVFKGENQAETMKRVLMHVADRVSTGRDDVPAGLDAVLAKALAKAPSDRYATSGEFGQALRGLLPHSESEVRANLAALLKHDFGLRMAEMLGIESLAERDEAWRRLSLPPQRGALSDEAREDTSRPRVRGEATRDRRTARPSIARMAETSMSVAPTRVDRGPRATADFELDAVLESGLDARVVGPDASRFRPRVAPSSGTEGLTVVDPSPPVGALAKLRLRSIVSSRALSVLLALLCGVGVFGVVASLRSPRIAPVAPRFRVVASQPASATTPPEAEAKSAAQGGSTEPPEVVAPEPSAPSKSRKLPVVSDRSGKHAGPDPKSLTQAFRSQQPKIEACFASHSKDLVGRPDIQVEFDLDALGRLKRAQVLPKSFGSTALGGCIERVSLATRFPTQGQAVSFAIPVRASRASGR